MALGAMVSLRFSIKLGTEPKALLALPRVWLFRGVDVEHWQGDQPKRTPSALTPRVNNVHDAMQSLLRDATVLNVP